ncbi:ATP-binding protein [Desulfosporosinus sp. FKA]|uniref:two-component system sensor histidine kinase NtrB n=1 Tax=Desulfosporosinus sp. FKA TaxID=1969834 RepID=UPI000B4A4C74|nr:ATP-binding protein [Desulfosporosinus sp. FKA]
MFSRKFRTLHRQGALLILSLLLIFNVLVISFTHLNIVFDLIIVLLPYTVIIIWFDLLASSWGKGWIMTTTLLLFFSLSYIKFPSIKIYIIHVMFLILLLGTMFLFDRSQIRLKTLHQRHIKAIRVLLHQKTSIIPTIDYTREAIMILDNSGTILESNNLSCHLLMLPESSLVGRQVSEILAIPLSIKSINSSDYGELTWKASQEGIKHLRYQTQPLLDNHKKPYGVLLTLYDISEEKKRSEAYVQFAKLSVITQVSAGLAHEIRNPLTTIKGFMQLIKPEEWPESFRPYRELFLEEIQSIDRILNKFILVTCPSAPHMKQLNLSETLRAILKSIEPCGKNRGISIILDSDVDPVYVLGDQEQLSEAFLSLLNNAIEASPQDGKVIVRLTINDQYVRISFIDYGHGIPENLRQRVLDPFFTTQIGGTGLGLTIAQRIVLAHHGKLHFKDSTQQSGTEVMIDLPLLKNCTNFLTA